MTKRAHARALLYLIECMHYYNWLSMRTIITGCVYALLELVECMHYYNWLSVVHFCNWLSVCTIITGRVY